MLSRLEKKGAVAHRENGRAKEFWPVLDQADACRRETRSFLDRLYGGSLGLMVSTLVGTEALTPGRCRGAGRTAPGGKGGETP